MFDLRLDKFLSNRKFCFMKQIPKTLGELPIGSRLLYRAKDDWRSAVISKIDTENATLIVCSPTGRTYRLRRLIDSELLFDGKIPILKDSKKENWRENFTNYDFRW